MSVWPSVGMKCVCVNNRFPDSDFIAPPDRLLVRGAIFTISAVLVDGGETCIHLREITREISPKHGRRLPFYLSRFRPLITRTQDEDVAAFKSLLQDMPLTERLDRIGELLG